MNTPPPSESGESAEDNNPQQAVENDGLPAPSTEHARRHNFAGSKTVIGCQGSFELECGVTQPRCKLGIFTSCSLVTQGGYMMHHVRAGEPFSGRDTQSIYIDTAGGR